MNMRFDGGIDMAAHGDTIWMVVGRRLHARRTELGIDVDTVAGRLGVSPIVYAAYESGNGAMPAWMLSELADLFEVGVSSFYQDIDFERHEEPEFATASVQACVFTVATEEQRRQALGDYFRDLDLDGQQHLLSLARALSRSG
jgi:transcriptional regulator with XRE-family HTH domain